VCLFRCKGASPEIPEIFPEFPDFPETPEKSPEYLGFTDKIVLSGDFQDSPIHPPRRHQDPFIYNARKLNIQGLHQVLGSTQPRPIQLKTYGGAMSQTSEMHVLKSAHGRLR
jgi:hypothetical protein